jgi:hypothetical protein
MMLRSFSSCALLCLLWGCGGRATESPSSVADASSSPDSSQGDSSTMQPMTTTDAQPTTGSDASSSDAGPHCECNNLAVCCARAAQADNGVACRADVAQGDENACRSAVLQGKYGCLGLGFTPQCSPVDAQLCPYETTRCTECLTSYRSCGPVIQCVVDPVCKRAWDAMVACDQQGRPFLDCFNILQSGSPPGELVLYGAQCVDTCQRDP